MTIGFKFFKGLVLSCQVCGDQFEQRTPTHIYCSKSCAARARNFKRRIKWEFLNYEKSGWTIKFKNNLVFILQPPACKYFDFPDTMVIDSWLPHLGLETGWITKEVCVEAVLAYHFNEAALFMKDAALMNWLNDQWGAGSYFWNSFLKQSGLDPLTRTCELCGHKWANLDACFECNDFHVKGQPDCVCTNCIADIIPF